jgi:small subunit ribosomal protein S18
MKNMERSKECCFCASSDLALDYKNEEILRDFLQPDGSIAPRQVSGACSEHQRRLTTEIKRARNLALVGKTS